MNHLHFDWVKAVVTDIDGTVMPEASTKLNPVYFDIISQLKAAGYQVIIASGRQQESIEYIFEPVLGEIDIVSGGGLCIKSQQGAEMLNRIPRAWLEEMEHDIELLANVDGLFSGMGISYAQHPEGDMSRFLRDSYKINLDSLASVGCLPDVPIGKVSLYSKVDIEERSKVFVEKWASKLSVTQAGEFWIDCVMPSINKAHAIEKLLSQYGISPVNLLASGDQMNDYGMLSMAGQSIAVSNAVAKLKEVATVCAPNEDYLAVARAWQALL